MEQSSVQATTLLSYGRTHLSSSPLLSPAILGLRRVPETVDKDWTRVPQPRGTNPIDTVNAPSEKR
jgi:hypothetical protein